MKDPTRDEMLAYLKGNAPAEEDEFEIEEAIYWFASHYHGGQASNLYAALCASQYRPGMNRRGPESPYLYDLLRMEYDNG